MLDVEPRQLIFRGTSTFSPHKMQATLRLHNPSAAATVFYRVSSSHSVYYSLFVSPVSGKLQPDQAVEVQFILPAIASVRHSAQPLQFVVQASTAATTSDMRTFWKYVDFLDVVETPIPVKIMPFEEDIWIFSRPDISSSSLSEDEIMPRRKKKEPDEPSKFDLEESRNDVIIRLIKENSSLRGQLQSLEKAVEYYDQIVLRHTELLDENAKLKARVEKLELSQVPFTCCVCLEEKPNIVLYPCRHVVLCRSCAVTNGARCPMCRAVTTQRAVVYF